MSVSFSPQKSKMTNDTFRFVFLVTDLRTAQLFAEEKDKLFTSIKKQENNMYSSIVCNI